MSGKSANPSSAGRAPAKETLSRSLTPSKETLSIGLSEPEALYVKAKADAAGLSTSKWIAALSMRHVEATQDDDVRAMLIAYADPRRDGVVPEAPPSRSSRVSVVIRSSDADVIRVAARRQGVTPHRWLQAVVYIGTVRQRVELPLSSRPAVLAHVEGRHAGHERALILLASTLSACLSRPDQAPLLAETIRHRGGLDVGAHLSPQALVTIAKEATKQATKEPDRTNVVELRPTPAPSAPVPEPEHPADPVMPASFTRVGKFVVDGAGNKASLDVFDTEQACIGALVSCTGCRDCTNCVGCVNCSGCSMCGQCRDCTDCHGIVAKVGLVDAKA